MKVIFVDRDGTMGGGYNIVYPKDYRHYEGTPEAFKILKEKGYKVFIFTNQACIARGKDEGYDFEKEFKEIGADDWFMCPHDNADNCNCRKPKTGLLEQAKEKYNLDLNKCFVVGDRWSDMLAGGKMKCKLALVLTGRGGEALGKDREKWSEYDPDMICNDLLEFARKVE